NLAVLPRALGQQHKGVEEWAQYKVLARRFDPLPVASAQQALDETVPELAVEMPLADSRGAEFHQLVATGDDVDHRCSVNSPAECAAAQRREILVFRSSLALDACPCPEDQLEPCPAVCVPVR